MLSVNGSGTWGLDQPFLQNDVMHRSPAINGLIVAGISNLWARLKEWRAVATRYEKTATSFLTVIHIAAVADWIKI
ncbi:transposase (plasmid) [Zymomonas mobilis subsp. mobilis str. CP4 = NRRL B-14023]|nr:transposase [Zymomonas mobilis subsp. mobilis NRRL B-12526]AHJ73246.1 transposase [Zymomonas mobilis subsp. mobilis str. CP4 = NRRL B-14023]